VDLIPEKVLNLWKSYFQKAFPDLMITSVRSFEVDKQEVISLDKKRRRMRRKAKQIPSGTKEMIVFLNSIIVARGFQPLEIPPQPDDNSQNSSESSEEEAEASSEGEEEDLPQVPEDPGQESQLEDPNKSFLTLGFIGHPNVGKSTLINTLNGKKVCSTSRTPGHTKYKQTVFLNDTVMLCDCPGLVFPAVDVPKLLQVVFGIYPIAQVREPYSSIRYIAERVPLETIYKLDKIEEDQPWTPYELCESYAEKRGYHTQKGRADTHRAALEILRDHLDGRVVLYFTPNSSRINVGVYDEGAVDIDLNEIKEENEDSDSEQNKIVKSKGNLESSVEEDEEEDEVSSDATSNPFSVLSDI
jgi:ribosome biogenesis GTPase A